MTPSCITGSLPEVSGKVLFRFTLRRNERKKFTPPPHPHTSFHFVLETVPWRRHAWSRGGILVMMKTILTLTVANMQLFECCIEM